MLGYLNVGSAGAVADAFRGAVTGAFKGAVAGAFKGEVTGALAGANIPPCESLIVLPFTSKRKLGQ